MATSSEFTGRVKVRVAGASGIPSIDNAAERLQAQDAARRAASARKAEAARPKPNDSLR